MYVCMCVYVCMYVIMVVVVVGFCFVFDSIVLFEVCGGSATSQSHPFILPPPPTCTFNNYAC